MGIPGSITAAAHSCIGNVAAGKAFAVGQGAGAGGGGLAIAHGLTQVGEGIPSLGSAGVAWAQRRF